MLNIFKKSRILLKEVLKVKKPPKIPNINPKDLNLFPKNPITLYAENGEIITTKQLFDGFRVIIFGVVVPFTEMCSKQVPKYLDLYHSFKVNYTLNFNPPS